jgi:hypothetical protein
MSTALLLGFAADQLVNIVFFCFLLAGSSATLLTPGRVTEADMLVVRAEFEQMLVRKGLLTDDQVDLIRHGTKSHAVVTGMRTTGTAREDHREVVLDVMVRRPDGGQFPAQQTALILASSLAKVSPGSIIETYYWAGDESSVAVCVPPG